MHDYFYALWHTHDHLRSSPRQIVLLLYTLVEHNCHKYQEASSFSEFRVQNHHKNQEIWVHNTCVTRDLHYRDTVMTLRCIKGLVPTYLCESLRRRKSIHYHNTRNRESLDIPPSKTKSGQRRFLHRAVNIWNSLDKDFKQLPLTSFKRKLKTHMLENYFNWPLFLNFIYFLIIMFFAV